MLQPVITPGNLDNAVQKIRLRLNCFAACTALFSVLAACIWSVKAAEAAKKFAIYSVVGWAVVIVVYIVLIVAFGSFNFTTSTW